MPILGSMLAGLFGLLFSFLAKRLTLGVAAAAAFVATSAAAWLATKAALGVVIGYLGGLQSPVLGQLGAAFVSFMPTNLAECFTAVLLMDTIATNYQYWRLNLPVAFQLARG